MRILKRIFHAGFTSQMHYRERRQVLIANYISVALALVVFIQIILREHVFQSRVTPVTQVYFLFCLVPLMLNSFRFTGVGRVSLSLIPVFLVWSGFADGIRVTGSVEQSMYDGMRLFLIAVSIIPYLVFDRTRPVLLTLSVLPTFLSILFFDQLVEMIGIGYSVTGVGGDDFRLMTMRTVSAYLIVNIACNVLLAVVAHNDEVNRRLIEELKRKTEEVNERNQELSRRKKDILALNRHLENLVDEKTTSIKKQNAILSNYAFTNAHKLRGPVARILGLINVFRLEKEFDPVWFVSRLEAETKDIDSVIQEISRELSQVDQLDSDTREVILQMQNPATKK